MRLYNLTPQYHKRSGERLEDFPEQIADVVDDYTGERISENEDFERMPIYSISINQIGGSEESWYYDTEKQWFTERNLLYATLWTSEFHFSSISNGMDNSVHLLKEWHASWANKDHIFFHVTSLDELLRKCRIRTVKKLLEEKTFTPMELGIDENIY